MRKIKFLAILFGLSFTLLLAACSPAFTAKQLAPQYYSPLKNAEYVSTGATIAVRYGPTLSDQDLAAVKFSVQGASSGSHTGQTILADDRQTVIFKPGRPFTPGEQVKVDVGALNLDAQHDYRALSYTFTVAANQQPGGVGLTNSIPDSPPKSAFPDFLTVPQDIPHFTVTTPSADDAGGDIFVAPFFWTKSTVGSYLLILNGQGQLVYYQSAADAKSAFDFKLQPNGLLSYFDQQNSTFYVMDSHYKVVNTYQAGNGYTADLHDLQLLPNGDALLMAYDAETVDMSKVVKGGKPQATVTGLIVQELDPSRNVIFEWRSWDHFAFTDSTASLTDDKVDLVHGNALALADDGNLLLSSRNQSEVTKINLSTGDIIWRFGGKANQFKLVNGQPFAYQHDVRQLPNGDITIFDNQGTQEKPAPSHGIEYKLDEKNMTATQVWEYTHTPPVFATFMGDTQRLSNGNTFLDWGAPSTADGYKWVTMNEVTADGKTVFELTFDQPYVSYRAFRFPWQGAPDTLPDLAFKADPNGNGITLGYSWNGATEVASWRLFGGSSPQSLTQVDEKTKTDFEMQSHLADLARGQCYFQVAALDKSGKEMARSKVISTDPAACPPAS